MQKVSTLSIDLAKNVFQIMAFDKRTQPCFTKRLNRAQLSQTLSQLPPCTIVMESCSTSHYWGRVCLELGHKVQLIPAQHVTPFVRGNKNDKNDCLAIFEASRRPHIRFVPVKTDHQQAILVLHRYRERLNAQRTACINQTRSLLLEFGVVIGKSYKTFKATLTALLDENIHAAITHMLRDVIDELTHLDKKLKRVEREFKQYNDQSLSAKIIQSLPGIGVINASAFSASIDKGQAFNNEKHFSVWLGITPRQYASGETNIMSGITKRGNRYLRKQLIHGARTIVNHAHKKDDDLNRWITALVARRGQNKAVVATAHRLARLMWVLLQKNAFYTPQFTQQNKETNA